MADVAKKMERTPPTIWRIEKGEVGVRTIDVRQLCQIYVADPQTTEDLVELAKQTKAPEWWRDYGNVIPASLDLLLSLERAADGFQWYEPWFIPGVFQTERYAREVIKVDDTLTEDDVQRRVRARLARQAVLARDNPRPRYDVLLGEHALTAPIPRDVLVEQLGRLVEVSELPHVTLRVVPFTDPRAGLHVGMACGPFNILEFPGGDDPFGEPTTVHVDGWLGSSYLSRPAEVAGYVEVFNSIAARSLDASTSRDLIKQRSELL